MKKVIYEGLEDSLLIYLLIHYAINIKLDYIIFYCNPVESVSRMQGLIFENLSV